MKVILVDRVGSGRWVRLEGERQTEAEGHSEASRTPRTSSNSKSKKLLSQRGLKPVLVHTASQDPTQTPWSLTRAILNSLFELSIQKLLSPGGGTVIIPIFQMSKQKVFSSVTCSHRDTQLGLDPGSLAHHPYTPEALTRRPQAQ